MATTTRRTTSSTDTLDRVTEIEVTESPQDSLEVSVNAKGEPSWIIKAYGNTAEEIEARARARALRELAEKHAHEIRDKKGAA